MSGERVDRQNTAGLNGTLHKYDVLKGTLSLWWTSPGQLKVSLVTSDVSSFHGEGVFSMLLCNWDLIETTSIMTKRVSSF